MIRKNLPKLKQALRPVKSAGLTQGGSSHRYPGSRPAATNGLAKPFKPFVITPVTLPDLQKPPRLLTSVG